MKATTDIRLRVKVFVSRDIGTRRSIYLVAGRSGRTRSNGYCNVEIEL